MLREYTDDVHLDVFLSQMLSVLASEEVERTHVPGDEQDVVEVGALFPGLGSGVGLGLIVVSSSVEPVAVAIDVMFFKVTELIHRVVF